MTMFENNKGLKVGSAIVVGVVVVAIIFLFVIGAVFYIWVDSLYPDPSPTPNFLGGKIDARISADQNCIFFAVTSGEVVWDDFRVMVGPTNGTGPSEIKDPETEGIVSFEGDVIRYNNDTWDPILDVEYTVIIVEISSNKVAWQRDIVAD